jgi:hypothetical protein
MGWGAALRDCDWRVSRARGFLWAVFGASMAFQTLFAFDVVVH